MKELKESLALEDFGGKSQPQRLHVVAVRKKRTSPEEEHGLSKQRETQPRPLEDDPFAAGPGVGRSWEAIGQGLAEGKGKTSDGGKRPPGKRE